MFIFKPWKKFLAYRDYKASWDFMRDVGNTGETLFRRRIRGGPKTGRLYGSHRASAPGEYPANRSGALAGSVGASIRLHRVDVGSNKFYSKFLRDGTSKMDPRSMSDKAMEEAIAGARRRMKPFVRFKHV